MPHALHDHDYKISKGSRYASVLVHLGNFLEANPEMNLEDLRLSAEMEARGEAEEKFIDEYYNPEIHEDRNSVIEWERVGIITTHDKYNVSVMLYESPWAPSPAISHSEVILTTVIPDPN